ncbi:MAG: serine hydroxymethyltransferase [Synergistaceae bacterium]|jgi:glycine hydroxymethyltransferase|nr:serine hydroxymethyltransferase [Synergistaceae bacterium]
MLKYTRASDPEVYAIVREEFERQKRNIEMIASESIVPAEILELNGSVFTNKTLEGYPGARFHAGGDVADKLEILANERTCALFRAEHANHQVYSGSTANYGVYSAILSPGDTILSMRLDQGGHLTHGSSANFLSKVYHVESYGIAHDTELIDYDFLEAKAREISPKLIIAGASSYSRIIDYERISKIAQEVEAYFLVDMAHITGLVASGLLPSPVPFADFVTSSTTKTTCGPRSGFILCKKQFAKQLDKGVFPGVIGSVHLNTLASKCWIMKYMASEPFKKLMRRVLDNSKILAEEMTKYGFRVVSGGTDNHLIVVDLRPRNITGKMFQNALNKAGITVNKNQIPFDPASPFITSGARLGTTSISQRGLKESEVREIVAIIDQVTSAPEDEQNLAECRNKGEKLMADFPLYPKEILEEFFEM